MTETVKQPVSDMSRDITGLVQTIGQSLNMASLYGVDHKVTRASLESSYPALAHFLESHDHMDINVVDNSLLVNGMPAEAPLAATVASRLSSRNLLSFEINQGFTLDEYIAFFSLVLSPAAKALGPASAQLTPDRGFQHIQTRAVGYRRVVEGEQEPPSPATPQAEASPPPAAEPIPDLDNVMAFLKNDNAADTRRSGDDIRQLANDAEKLAELILRSVEVRAAAANITAGESLNDIVVGAIGKIVAELTTPGAVRTEKARKQTKRSLMLLEGAVLQKLQKLAGDKTGGTVSALIEEASESLDMETMTSKFLKSHRAAEESGDKLRRVISRASGNPVRLQELHDDLCKHGLTEAAWQELIISRDTPPSDESVPPHGMAQIKTLTALLAKLGEVIGNERVAPSTEPSPEIQSVIAETGRQLSSLAATTERKIENLRRTLHQQEGQPDAPVPQLSRKQLIEFLAEIGQELSQPLTVVATSIDMLRDQRQGLLTETQGELLALASDSSKRLSHLVGCLIKIAGTPQALQPDQTILSAIYNKPDAS